MKLDKPKNCWAKCLYILYDCFIEGTSMAKILLNYDPTFYKWQTRLLEIEKAHPKLNVSRSQVAFKTKFGSDGHYTKYICLNARPYLLNLYNLLNEKGLEGSISENTKKVPHDTNTTSEVS